MEYTHDDTQGVKAGQVQNLDFLQYESDASIEPPNRYLFGPEVLELTVRFWTVTPCRHRQTGSDSQPSAIGVVLLFCAKVDVVLNLAVKYAPELLVGDNATTLFLHGVWFEYQRCVQEAICWDEKSVVFAGLECEDFLPDGIHVQVIFTSQVIQKLEIGEMEGYLRPGVDCESALWR